MQLTSKVYDLKAYNFIELQNSKNIRSKTLGNIEFQLHSLETKNKIPKNHESRFKETLLSSQ